MKQNNISKMTRQEKLQTMDALWDSLAHDADSLASPVWHGDVLAARRTRIESGQARFVSLDALRGNREG